MAPYNSWDAKSLQNYLTTKGQQAKKGTEQNTKSLAEQVKVYWTETEDSANQAYGSVKDWIFDSYVFAPSAFYLLLTCADGPTPSSRRLPTSTASLFPSLASVTAS